MTPVENLPTMRCAPNRRTFGACLWPLTGTQDQLSCWNHWKVNFRWDMGKAPALPGGTKTLGLNLRPNPPNTLIFLMETSGPPWAVTWGVEQIAQQIWVSVHPEQGWCLLLCPSNPSGCPQALRPTQALLQPEDQVLFDRSQGSRRDVK